MRPFRQPRMNQANPAMGAYSQPGFEGSQSGPGMRGPDAMFEQPPQDMGAFAPGQEGSQSGPAEESSSAEIERLLQMLGSYGVSSVGGAVGFGMGGGIPGAAVGMMPGAAGMANAVQPNIQDVWAHQMMQKLRTRGR